MNRSGSTSTSSNDSNSDRSGNRNNSSFPVQEEVVETVGVEKEVEEKITVQPVAVEALLLLLLLLGRLWND